MKKYYASDSLRNLADHHVAVQLPYPKSSKLRLLIISSFSYHHHQHHLLAMALNWTMLNPNRSPVPLPNEMTITTIDSGVDVTLTIPDAPPSGTVSAGGSGGAKKMKSWGKVYLTDQRVCYTLFLFVQNQNADSLVNLHIALNTFPFLLLRFYCSLQIQFIFTTEPGSSFESLSVPLHSILATRFEQPTFGANYLTFDVKPSPEGGLTDGTKVEVRFKDRAMFEFVSLLEKARERSIYMRRQAATEEDEGLRK